MLYSTLLRYRNNIIQFYRWGWLKARCHPCKSFLKWEEKTASKPIVVKKNLSLEASVQSTCKFKLRVKKMFSEEKCFGSKNRRETVLTLLLLQVHY